MITEIIDRQSWQPITVTGGQLEKFISEHPQVRIVDQIQNNLTELFLLRHPQYRFDENYQAPLQDFLKLYGHPDFGQWFYFPWTNQLVRYLPENLHLELRTGRNKNLITGAEQARFYYSTVAVLGLSVGSHVAIVIAMTGGVKHFKLADPDNLSGDNLNRIRAGFQNVGMKKVVVTARQIFEINPYSEIALYPGGINDETAAAILDESDVLIEEMDNPYWKLRARELARARGLSVLMGTDNGDGAIVDVERFDLDRSLPILNGLAGDLTTEKLKSMKPEELPVVAAKIAGGELIVPRMLESVAEVGKSLYSWPQLGTAANLCGSLLAYLARRIIIGDENAKSGRYSISPEKIF